MESPLSDRCKMRTVQLVSRLGRRLAATTILEMTVGATLISVLLASSVPMLATLARHQRQLEHRTLALTVLDNALEEWLAQENAWTAPEGPADWSLPRQIRDYLPGTRVTIAADPPSGTPPARRVTARIAGSTPSAPAPGRPLQLTTWIYP